MPQKQKLSAEEKAKVIENYINNRISLSEAARQGSVARDTISQWARNYEADVGGLLYGFHWYKFNIATAQLKMMRKNIDIVPYSEYNFREVI